MAALYGKSYHFRLRFDKSHRLSILSENDEGSIEILQILGYESFDGEDALSRPIIPTLETKH